MLQLLLLLLLLTIQPKQRVDGAIVSATAGVIAAKGPHTFLSVSVAQCQIPCIALAYLLTVKNPR